MNRILITGGTGHLGRKVAKTLISQNYKVGVLSTKTFTPTKEDNITYYMGNLAENTGLKKATNNVDVVIHCASNPRDFQLVDVEGTKNLLKAIGSRAIKHFVYISIVGVDKSDYPYYQAKLEVENLVSNSGFPYTIVRTTQFHSFVVNLIQNFINETTDDKSILKIPKELKFQSIGTQEVAELLARISLESPKGLLPDFGGPKILSFEKMTDSYLKEFHPSWEIQTEMTNDIRHQLFRTGVNLSPNNTFGKEDWNTFIKTINYK
ncbi:hypothetical protein APS56_02660 [Pseudalgibacter alginicilyticus]|uniref:NAD(P)-binding domain-containing protein n=1 Tax=Pseudalgibacter alginicilyticus TaxID=1736674 RepID=A0A0N7HY31_9FLAO|nr:MULTISPECIES: NAD(P)H-binding protein [Flavobacteriaceae]ALJ04118.1 hypothetical protein APS56_02660 [Pseudalgibacter alginicilyticus]